jgi:hypothetical protein
MDASGTLGHEADRAWAKVITAEGHFHPDGAAHDAEPGQRHLKTLSIGVSSHGADEFLGASSHDFGNVLPEESSNTIGSKSMEEIRAKGSLSQFSDPARNPVIRSIPKGPIEGTTTTCKDDHWSAQIQWSNRSKSWKKLKHAWDCGTYVSKGWCANRGGNFKSGWKWAIGTNGKTARDACCLCGGGEKYTMPKYRKFDCLDKKIISWMRDTSNGLIAGASLAVMKNGNIAYLQAYGEASIMNNPVTMRSETAKTGTKYKTLATFPNSLFRNKRFALNF